jgi:hypothetical protein
VGPEVTRTSLQDIFVQHFPAYAATRALHPRQQRAAQSISQCYTPALGSHVLHCPEGHYERLQPHACRHRSCPRCVEPARSRWIDSQMLRLLPCPHFHCVFTVPHELLALWAFNRATMTQLLFECARASLLQIMADPRRLGVLPGVLMSLHTWGRNLSHHPHLHCLVTAGGLDAQQQWKSCRSHVPISALPLKRLFRGKLLSSLGQLLTHQRLALPPELDRSYWRSVIRTLYRKPFNVEVCDVYEHGRGVALYLARYVKGGPLPKERPLYLDDTTVRFQYTDHRDHRTKTQSLPVQQFIDRILWHAPPKGQHLTRYAGLYSSARQQHHRLANDALAHQASPPSRPPHPAFDLPPPLPPEPPRCPSCSTTLLRTLRPRAHHQGEVSLSRLLSAARTTANATRAPPPALSNPSLKLTRSGSQRLAAPGTSGNCPSAARRRPPARAT